MPVDSTHRFSTREVLWRSVWPVALAFVIFQASGESEVAAPPGIPGIDKIAHFSVFGLLATLCLRVLFDARRPLRTALFAALVVSAYGAFDEVRQSFTPGRDVEALDWLADTGGALLAVALYGIWPRWRNMLESSVKQSRGPAVSPSERSREVASLPAEDTSRP